LRKSFEKGLKSKKDGAAVPRQEKPMGPPGQLPYQLGAAYQTGAVSPNSIGISFISLC
jgi:hypothetical protein